MWSEPRGRFQLPLGSLNVYDKSIRSTLIVYGMSKAPAAKRMGRPPKKDGPAVVVPARLPPALASAVDAWAAASEQPMTRSEAIRRLVELGLAKGKGKAR